MAWLVAALILAGAALWWAARWTPSRTDFAVQGVTISAANGAVRWGSVKAAGADFAYLGATAGDAGVDRSFARNSLAAADTGIRTGAIHHYDLCATASDQAANFIRTVPRKNSTLPSAVWFDFDDRCTARPTQAMLLSEITTFLAQIEAHMGKRTIVAPSAAFDEAYAISSTVARTTWLRRNFFAPTYGSHRWTMWQANEYFRITGAAGTVGWNVIGESPE